MGLLDRLTLSQRYQSVIVEWPENATFNKDQFAVAAVVEDEKISLAVGEAKDWFRVDAKIEINGESVDIQALLRAIRDSKNYLQLKSGKWLKISQIFKERLARLQDCLDQDPADDSLHADPYSDGLEALKEAEEVELTTAGKDWWATKRQLTRTRDIDESLPASLTVSLRDYQLTGYRWLNRLAALGIGCCLADDMGLGKTVQAIAVLTQYAARGPALVVAPLSVQQNWAKELRRFSPQLRPVLYRGGDRLRLLSGLGPGDIVIMTYGLVWRDVESLRNVNWHAGVYDEAQNIKNARSKTAKAIQSLNVKWHLALSGTPIENHLGDLWSLFRTINPSLLGSWQRFRSCYGFPISRDQNQAALQRLNARVRPFILRRLKKDYLHELPEKTEIVLDVELSTAEKDIYEGIRMEALGKLQTADNAAGDDKDRMQVLAALTKLRQAACHPRLVYDLWQHSSSKLELFLNLAEQLVEGGHKVLVFSQFTRHLKLVEQKLLEQNYSYRYLDGSCDAKERQRAIDEFQSGRADFFLISLKAGGTGITLTQADYVVHLDPWWNPAIEDQATDRAYRLGQTRPVTVYRLVAKDTIEAEVISLHEEKRSLAQDVLAGSGAIDKLPFAALKNLILQKPASRQTPAEKPN